MKKEFNLGLFSKWRTEIMGAAILWIMFFHSRIDCSDVPVVQIIKCYGNVGVDIFLVLSGIGLYYLTSKLAASAGSPRRIATDFFRNRMIRILPATVLCLCPWYLYLYSTRSYPVNPIRFFLDITSLSYWIDGNNRGWYMALTIVLYFFYPILFLMVNGLLLRNTKKMRICMLLLVSIIAVNAVIAVCFPKWFSCTELALGRVPVFVFGCFLAPCVKEEKKIPVWVRGGTSVLFVALPFLIKDFRDATGDPFCLFRYGLGIMGVCATILFAQVIEMLQGGNWIKIFSFAGRYSLELYLTHTQIQTVVLEARIVSSGMYVSLIAAALSIVLAVVLHEGVLRVGKILR